MCTSCLLLCVARFASAAALLTAWTAGGGRYFLLALTYRRPSVCGGSLKGAYGGTSLGLEFNTQADYARAIVGVKLLKARSMYGAAASDDDK
jgi:hypothetical protein